MFVFFTGAGECSAKAMNNFYQDGNLMEYLPNYDFLCIDYPSYGESDGLAYNYAMRSMALNVYDKAITLDGIDQSKITVAGYSIGTGPAAYLAEKRDVASLILIATYDKYYHIENADRSDWNQFICGYNVNPVDYAKHIKKPSLILTSDADRTCEYKSAKRVADRIKNSKMIKLSGVKHENMLCDQSFQYISDFLKQ